MKALVRSGAFFNAGSRVSRCHRSFARNAPILGKDVVVNSLKWEDRSALALVYHKHVIACPRTDREAHLSGLKCEERLSNCRSEVFLDLFQAAALARAPLPQG